MKRLITCLILFCTLKISAQIPNVYNDPKWNLVFSDEFDSVYINTNKWKSEGFWFRGDNTGNCNGIYNNAKRAYVRPNYPPVGINEGIETFPDSGYVRLKVHKFPSTQNIPISCYSCNVYTCDSCDSCATWPVNTYSVDFVAGKLISKEMFKLGYFELKFRIPNTPSDNSKTYRPFGPNFWLYNESISSTTSCYSEIDIFEVVDGQKRTYTANGHFTPTGSDSCGHFTEFSYDPPSGEFGATNITGNAWHIAAAYWTPEKVDYFLDGVLFKSNYLNWVSSYDSMSVILDINAPLGRENATIDLANSNVAFPYNYDIDYIRIFQPSNNCNSSTKSYCTTTPSIWDTYTVYENITFGGSSCGTTDFSTISTSLYANDYILIDENTILGGGSGSSIFLEVNSCYP